MFQLRLIKEEETSLKNQEGKEQNHECNHERHDLLADQKSIDSNEESTEDEFHHFASQEAVHLFVGGESLAAE